MAALEVRHGEIAANRNITTPAITRRLMLEDAEYQAKPIVMLDIDLTHGYDTVETWVKDAALRRMGVPHEAIERDGDTALGRWWVDTNAQQAGENNV